MKPIPYTLAAFILSSLFIPACAQKPVAQTLDEKLAQESTVKTTADYETQSDQTVNNAPGITDDQKKELMAYRESVRAQSSALQQESLKLRAVLVKNLLAPNYNTDEVERIKSKIRDIEQERLRIFFSAVREMNTKLGRWGSRRERQEDDDFYNQMLE